ncbi:MarR family winged helix-turn-helix transcriptional regulator [Salininema proteolyticum]|uniref:MarR family winged helix-turn-helix transcriptional regulator n=1 Tax=Salininema proteolyticum TaxID=1607685 RepID=A0ABV8TWJ7_9ACTN
MNDNRDSLASQLRVISVDFYRMLRRLTPNHHLTLSQGLTLRLLVKRGPQRLSELAAAESVSLPSMNSIVGRLEREGLAVKEPDPSDRRAVRISVTDEGRRYYDDLADIRHRFLKERLGELTEGEIAALEAALPAFEKLLDWEGSRPDDTGKEPQ